MELHIINNKNNLLILNIYLVHFLEDNLNQMFYKLQVKYIHFVELQYILIFLKTLTLYLDYLIFN